MNLFSFALILACAPKQPPPGSVDISESLGIEGAGPAPRVEPGPVALPMPVLQGVAPLPLGSALPWEGEPTTESQRAFIAAEAGLAALNGDLHPPLSREQATDAVDRALEIQSQLRLAALEVALAGPAAVRMGDAFRIAADYAVAVEPDPGLSEGDREAFTAAREAARVPLLEGALESYEEARGLLDPEDPWYRHAAWAERAIGVTP
jgi:hypothetical protein